MGHNPNSMLPPPLNPGAPADPETLKRLKEELLQQKQQTAPGKFAAAAAAGKDADMAFTPPACVQLSCSALH